MRLKILGSAAAEGFPGFWCSCEFCNKARELGGKNIRRRSAYLLDEDTLVDCGPDMNWQMNEFGIDPRNIERLLITHSHSDHLCADQFYLRSARFSHVPRTLKVFGNAESLRRINEETYEPGFDMFMDMRAITHGDVFTDGDLTVTAIPAVHIKSEPCFNFVLSRHGKSALIASDTGWWSAEGWALAAQFKFNVVVLECTFGLMAEGSDANSGHMGCYSTLKFRDELARLGALAEGCRVAANHYSHNAWPLQHELDEFYRGTGIEAGYDGMTIEV